MTVANNYAPVVTAANGVAVNFSGPWNALAAANIVVQLYNVAAGTYTPVSQGAGASQYQVTSVTASGFTIQFNTAPASGNNVVITRNTPQVQTQPYTTSRGFQGNIEEGSFDALTAMMQETQDGINRSLKAPVGSTLAPVLISTPVDQTALIWSGTGGSVANGPSVGQITNAAAAAATAVNAASTATAAATQAQLNAQNAPVYNCPTVSGTNTIALTTSAAVTSYADGQIFEFTPANSITGAATANVNTIGAVTILDEAGNALATGAIVANVPTAIMKKGSNFYLMMDARNVKTAQTIDNSINDFRLTLSSGVPVTTTDVTGATSVFLAPYKGNRISLYNGTSWNIRTTAQISIALGTLTSGKAYDIFVYDNAGVPTLELGAAWNSDTTRFASGPYATALPTQDGVYVKSTNGTAIDATRRYLGTFYTTSTTTTEDSAANRYLWNYYSRVKRQSAQATAETTASWTYATASYRQANANTNNQYNILIGVSEDSISVATPAIPVFNSTATARNTGAGIGIDSTTVNSATQYNLSRCSTNWSGVNVATYEAPVATGKHTISWLEKADGTDTQTFIGAFAAGYSNLKITGALLG